MTIPAAPTSQGASLTNQKIAAKPAMSMAIGAIALLLSASLMDATVTPARQGGQVSSKQRKKRIIRRAARKEHISPAILWGVYGAESNFGKNKNDSSKGAQGPFQIMPFHEGVDPHNFRQAAQFAAHYLGEYKNRGTAGMLAAYNAGPAGNPNNSETRAYIPRVEALARTWRPPKGGRGQPGMAPRTARNRPAGGTVSGPDIYRTIPGTDNSDARTALKQNYLLERGKPGALLALAVGLNQAKDVPASVGGRIGGNPAGQATSGVRYGRPRKSMPRVRLGKVTVAPTANRAGVGLNRKVRRFVRQIAGLTGRSLTIGTGSNHNQYTINGTESAHWRGNAADVPLAGKALVRAGRAALIAAGMSPEKARQINGGGFNVGGWQIIFNTDAPGWGDHTDHLHVGRR